MAACSPPRSCWAACSGVQSRVGLVLVVTCSVVVVSNVPDGDAVDLFFTPLIFVVGWVVGYALRERNQQAEDAEERAQRAEREWRPRPASPLPRSGRGWRASSTTSWLTR